MALANITKENNNSNNMYICKQKTDTNLDVSAQKDTIVITKIVLDFDDALFPSHCYREHKILKYHESTSDESVDVGRDLFKTKEPKFMKLKKNIDLVIFKLMQIYAKDNFVILSTGDKTWIESTLQCYNYLLYAYKTSIYSTQEWHKNHPNDFDNKCSLEAKSFLMKMLLKKWKTEAKANSKYADKNIKFRLISIGDSFFEFLSCYNIGFDYVNRIKLLEEPTVEQMIHLWNQILYLCQSSVYDSNVVFIAENEYYYLKQKRMHLLNEQCVTRLKSAVINPLYPSLLDIITHQNRECYEIKTTQNGKQYKLQKHTKSAEKAQSDSNIVHSNVNIANAYHYTQNYMSNQSESPLSPSPVPQTTNTNTNTNMNSTNFVYNSYAQIQLQQQQMLAQIQQSQQFMFNVPQYTNYYSNPYNTVMDPYQYNNYEFSNTITTSNYNPNTI